MSKTVCVISRQRVIGNTNGSSVYLLGLCKALHDAGLNVRFLCPSPAVFGRWPLLVMRPEMRMFRSIRIRGALRLGRVFIALDPRIGVRAVCSVLARKMGLSLFAKPAPYSIAVPLTDHDKRYLARHGTADTFIADYAFLTETLPFVRSSEARSAVIMHDLLSSTDHGPSDANAKVDLGTELKMLERADAVIAIQQAEADAIRTHLPNMPVICAPLAVTPVADPQPGHGQEVLFVASKTKANVDAVWWFLQEVWPLVREKNPDATFLIAGTVAESIPTVPDGVRKIGFVTDLNDLYAQVAVIVSPLRGGSGLKIKLVEAMAQGKAIVASTVTLQGVEGIVGPAVVVADEAEEFANGIERLLTDMNLRMIYAEAALNVARTRFSAQSCYAEFVRYVAQGSRTDGPASRRVQPRPTVAGPSAMSERRANAH